MYKSLVVISHLIVFSIFSLFLTSIAQAAVIFDCPDSAHQQTWECESHGQLNPTGCVPPGMPGCRDAGSGSGGSGGRSYACFVCDAHKWRGVADPNFCPANPPECNPNDNTDDNWEGCVGGGAVQGGECDVNRCGDGICTNEESTSKSCPQDCGANITNSGGSCLPLEFARVKVPVNAGRNSTVIEGSNNTISFLNSNQVLKPLNDGLTKIWEMLRGPKEATQNPEDYFHSPNSRIIINGKIIDAPEGAGQLTAQGIDLPINDLSQYSTRAERVSSFTTSPRSAVQTSTQSAVVTDFPVQDYQPQGKIVIPTDTNLFSRLLSFARDKIQAIQNWFRGKTEVDMALSSCTYDDLPNYIRSMKIAGLTNTPGSLNTEASAKRVLNNSTPANISIKSGTQLRNETVDLQTRATASLYKSMERQISQLSPPSAPYFMFGSGGVTTPGAVALPTSPIANTTLNTGHIALINSLMSVYKQAANQYHLPWQMLAAIHYVEGGNNPTQSLLNGDAICNNKDGSRGPNCNQSQDTLHDALDAALHLQGKVGNQLQPTGNSEALVKDAFWGYNGRVYGSYDRSPYVMNNWDNAHRNMQWCGRTNNGSYSCGTQTIDGTWKVFVLLINAEYDLQGALIRLRT